MTWDGDENRLELWHDCKLQAVLRLFEIADSEPAEWFLFDAIGRGVWVRGGQWSSPDKETAKRAAEAWVRGEEIT